MERARPFLHHEEEPRLFSERLQERLMHCVQEGDPRALKLLLQELPRWNLATFAHEPLRSLRNQIIAIGALAFQGGGLWSL